jgi:predicted alpha/beta-fold hydrolase
LIGQPRAVDRVPVGRHLVEVSDDDWVVLHDECPAGWRAGGRTALLVHGMCGSAGSPYMVRVAARLRAAGVRTFRMDQRGCGAGLGLARLPYHSGRSEDIGAAIAHIAMVCPDSRLALVAFSLAGNAALKLAAEWGGQCSPLDRVIAVCPPIDLARAAHALQRPLLGRYDRFFLRQLLGQWAARERACVSGTGAVRPARRPRTVVEFDDAYTAPVCGFGTAERYYAACRAAPLLPAIRVPTLIVAARDDPVVPGASLEGVELSASTSMMLVERGGHLGFIGRRGVDPDGRWMDWRIVAAVAHYQSVG